MQGRHTILVLDGCAVGDYQFGMSRLKKYREAAELSQEQLAKAAGTSQPQIKRLEAGERKLTREWAERLAPHLGVRPTNLLFDEEDPEGFTSNGEIIEARPADGILEIDTRAGLGAGGSDDREVRHDGDYADPVKSESWKFPSRFMREEVRAAENQVIILETDGDSMQPTIGSGERIIVHTGMRQPSPDGIFALRDTFGNIIAKRLQVLRKGDPPRVLVISDNKAHATEEVGLDEIHIVGRVLWGLRRL